MVDVFGYWSDLVLVVMVALAVMVVALTVMTGFLDLLVCKADVLGGKGV